MYTYDSQSSQGDHRDGPRCQWVSAYTTKDKSVVNHYVPAQNIMAKALWLSANQGNCGLSFYRAFANNSYEARIHQPVV
jgi:hypothetical protein